MNKFFIAALSAATVGLCLGSTANAKTEHNYLDPCSTTNNCPDNTHIVLEDAVGKVSVNCDTGALVFRGHGLQAGHTYDLRSGGDLGLEDGDAVGNGLAGLGNNVLIKGTIGNPGGYWNLWDTTDKAGRVLRGPNTICE